MTSYERTARRIVETLCEGPEEKLVRDVILILIDEQPGRNDALLEAYLVANWHKQLYPEDVFPRNGLTPDAWAAKGCRLVADSIMNRILDLQTPPIQEKISEADRVRYGLD